MPILTCLLIDDDPDDREIFALALEDVEQSCNYVTAESGPDAIKMLKSDPPFCPDFIFLDLNMPMMDGKECLLEIKKIKSANNIPIIIYSTSSYEKDVEDTRNLGATNFLTKPSSVRTLSAFLTEIMNRGDMPFFLKG